MTIRTIFQRPPRRLLGCGFALALACLFALPAAAAPVTHSGSFADDGSGNDAAPDDFTLTNDGSSNEDITTIVLDLTNATIATTFEPATHPFVADPTDAAATGFTGEFVTATTLTLTFTDFNAGESFSFTIDVDDNNNRVEGSSIAGSEVTATFAITGDVTAVMVDAGGNNATWTATVVPEPSTMCLFGLGLTGLTWGKRRRS